MKKLLNLKVDNSIFDSEIDGLKDLINQLANSGKEIKIPISTGSNISAKEVKDILARLEALESEMKKKADKLTVEKEFSKTSKEISSIRDWCEKLEEMIKKIMSQLSSFISESTHQSLVVRVERLEAY